MSKKSLNQLIFSILLLGIWEVIGRLGLFHPALFPPLSVVLERFFQMILKDQLFAKTIYSIGVVVLAMIFSAFLTFFLIVIGEKNRFLKDNVELLNSVLSPLPGIAVLPLVILWFGLSQTAMMVVLIHATLWPFWAQMSLAVNEIKKTYGKMIKVFKISKFSQAYHIYFLGTRSDLLVGLSVAWSRGWRALLSVEMIFGLTGSYSGLGWLIYERRMYMDTPGLFAGLLAIAGLGIFVDKLFYRTLNGGQNV